MSEFHGQFCWCELMTTDDAAATAFYGDVIGWNARDAGASHVRYTILSADETGIGGIVALPQSCYEAGARPFWIGYIAVDDVDVAARRVTQLGGAIHRPADDIPDVGRFAVVADPHGAVFTLFTPAQPDLAPKPQPRACETPGHVGWHELHAGDREAAFSFYADLFGWTKTEAVDLGPIGTYQTFATGGVSGSSMVGGMMTKTEAMPRPIWIHYFNVDDIEAAVSRTTAAGGEILMGPHQVPGGAWIAQCRDVQGALFAMIGPNR
jgi:predicted enzyme related to lactoylglutathione lyase